MKRSGEHLARVHVASQSEWRAWLEAHHTQPESIWLVTYKKTSTGPHVPYAAIVEEALCFGWIDSLPRKLDQERTMLLLSPRKRGSGWSKLNKARAERLIAEGRMTEPGLAAIAAARADGSWDRLDAVDRLAIPEDLAAALAQLPGARETFDCFPPSTRRGILEWIAQARRAQTRAARITDTARKAALGIRANTPRQPRRGQRT
ncbi:MAG: YdeI/OmpD-associated family protein [Hyphomicrobiaceae bacterium]|nr:YdeI/OmpD-associated family protein [Hyphomicrobiaceae bacterium]